MNLDFPQVGMEFAYGFFHYGMGVLCDIHFRIRVSGGEHLPRRGGFIVAANHASLLDPPIVGAQLPRQVAAFARKSLWKGGIASWWLTIVGVIPVDRDGGSDVRAIRRVLQALKQEKGIILFPEGTRSRTGEMGTFKAGLGMLVAATQVPVVPCFLRGTYAAWPSERKWPRRGAKISLHIGLPLRFDDVPNNRDGWRRIAGDMEETVRVLGQGAPG